MSITMKKTGGADLTEANTKIAKRKQRIRPYNLSAGLPNGLGENVSQKRRKSRSAAAPVRANGACLDEVLFQQNYLSTLIICKMMPKNYRIRLS